LTTKTGKKGYGMTFTLGRGTNIICCAIDTLKIILENKSVDEIYLDFSGFWRKLTSEPQLRWVFKINPRIKNSRIFKNLI
jgi:L-fuconate dehydratase